MIILTHEESQAQAERLNGLRAAITDACEALGGYPAECRQLLRDIDIAIARLEGKDGAK